MEPQHHPDQPHRDRPEEMQAKPGTPHKHGRKIDCGRDPVRPPAEPERAAREDR